MNDKMQLDKLLVQKGLANNKSQAVKLVRLEKVKVNGSLATDPRMLTDLNAKIELEPGELYVSRAGFKLASAADALTLDFNHKVVLDVGSSTGGFTDYALKHGAKKVYAVDVGKNQLHPSLRLNHKIELHEQTDIREITALNPPPNIILIDVSFISLRDILPHLNSLSGENTLILAMVKPQFESTSSSYLNNGVVKNERLRRAILKNFELWARETFYISDKADSSIPGVNGNIERFYLLKFLKY